MALRGITPTSSGVISAMQKSATWANVAVVAGFIITLGLVPVFGFLTRINQLEWNSIRRDQDLLSTIDRTKANEAALNQINSTLTGINVKLGLLLEAKGIKLQ